MKTDFKTHRIQARATQQGFSLIELMIVIVIIGVLGSIAAPAYKDYVVRAKVTEFFALAQPAKLAVTEAILSNVAVADINNESLGLGTIENIGAVRDITIANAIIAITGDSKKLDLPAGRTLKISLTPRSEGGGITWSCSTTPVEFNKYVPSNCRASAAADAPAAEGAE